MNDKYLRDKWIAAGGKFHGPNVETGYMPEHLLLPFLKQLAGGGYVEAFYQLSTLMDLPAQAKSPEQVWQEQMLPRLKQVLGK